MSALVTDPSTHATWSPSLNGPALAREMSWGFVDKLERIIDQLDREGDRAWVIAAVNDWAAGDGARTRSPPRTWRWPSARGSRGGTRG